MLYTRLLEMACGIRLPSRCDEAGLPESIKDLGAAERVTLYVQLQQTRFFRQETLDEAARSVGISRRQFTTLFREIAGKSWHEYRLQLRLKYTAKLLKESDSSVITIAFEAGFEDLSNFNRAFKRAYDCTPRGYREKVRVYQSNEDV